MTLREAVIGFLLAVVVGLVLATLVTISRVLRLALYPLIVASQAMPVIALAPLLVVWFGYGPTSKILVATLIAFFPIVVSTAAGLASLDASAVTLMESFPASRYEIFVRARLPNALPQTFSGIKVAAPLAVVGAVVGEWVSADAGLGYLIIRSNASLATEIVFGGDRVAVPVRHRPVLDRVDRGMVLPSLVPKGSSMMSVTEAELEELREWDERHYAHVFATADEYQHTLIVDTDGDYIYTATGERLVDFTSGLLCVNAGQRNQRVRDAIVAAMDRFGFVWEGFANPYRTRAAKLIMEDVLGADGWAGRIRFTSSGSGSRRAGDARRQDGDWATEHRLARLRLPRLDTRRAFADGSSRLAGHPRRSRRRSASPARDPDAGRPLRSCSTLPALSDRAHLPGVQGVDGNPGVRPATEHMIRTLGSDTVAAMVVEPIFGVGMIHRPPSTSDN